MKYKKIYKILLKWIEIVLLSSMVLLLSAYLYGTYQIKRSAENEIYCLQFNEFECPQHRCEIVKIERDCGWDLGESCKDATLDNYCRPRH
ncbi:hypothetical protein C0584_01970 [Candidatus Parcubacteria bacterium]|nr:MAG: hypothetical protein C0584_01970 [Candidatus Parcubacteria bacterium]